MSDKRPLDLLNKALGSQVLVCLKGGRELRGKLSSFDMHMNLVLEGTEELEGTESLRRYGDVLVRGDSIIFISPAG